MKSKLISSVYWVVLGLALLALAVQMFPVLKDYFQYDTQAIAYPYSIDYGEGPLLDQTMRLSHFQNIYANTFSRPPYTISNYPPLYLLVQVPFAWIFGPAYWYGRLINLLSVLLTALFICLTLRALTRDWIGAAVGGLLLVAVPYVQHWSKFNRIDELALVLSWAGLYVLIVKVGLSAPLLVDEAPPSARLLDLARKGLSYRPFWLGALLLVASIFTRQTYALAAPFAAFFWLIFGARGRWKQRILQALLLAVVVAGLTLLLFLLLTLATAGGFYLNVIVANVNAFYWNNVWHYANEIKDRLWPLLFLGAAFLLAEGLTALIRWISRLVRSRRARTQPVPAGTLAAQPLSAHTQFLGASTQPLSVWALLLPYLLAAAAGSITIGKDGSNVNYLLEFSAAVSLASGAALAWAWRWPRWYVRLPIQLLVIGLLAYQCNVLTDWNRRDYVTYMQYAEATISQVAQTEEIIRSTPGYVLADEFMGLIPLARKQLYFQPFEFKQMSDAKIWDQTPFLEDIAAHKFSLIVWYQPSGWEAIKARYTPAQIDAVTTYYMLDRQFGDIQIYIPKN